MSFTGLRPANGDPKKPSVLRDELQHTVGSVLPDHIIDGGKFSYTSGLTLSVKALKAIIGSKYHRKDTATDIVLPARMACLIYALKKQATDSVESDIGVVQAKIPIDMIDNNTVGFWIFNKAGNIPNSAVGKSSAAVANDLVPTGSVTTADGYCDYAVKGDGTLFYTSQNSNGFPVNAAEFEVNVGLIFNSLSEQYILRFNAGTHSFKIRCVAGVLSINDGVTDYSSGYTVTQGQMVVITVGYDTSKYIMSVSGNPIYTSPAITRSSTASVMYVLYDGSSSLKSTASLHFIELRNKMRTPTQIATIANKLLLPSIFTGSQQVDRSTGTAIGDMTASGGLNAAFDGSYSKVYSSCAKIVASQGYVGKLFSAQKTITQIDLYGSSDRGFDYGGSGNVTCVVQAGDGTTFTDIYTATFSEPDNATVQSIPISTNVSALAWRVKLSRGGTEVYVGQMVFWEKATSGDIRSVLPTDSVSLGFVRTNSTAVVEYDDSIYKYGRREGAYGGNRVKQTEWKYVTNGTVKDFINPFGTERVKVRELWFKKNLTDAKHSVVNGYFYNVVYGCYLKEVNADKVIIKMGIIDGDNSYTGTGESSGYICAIMEVLE